MILQSYSCEICSSGTEETVEHLFWGCPFAQQCWGSINLHTLQNADSVENVKAIRIQLRSTFFMNAIIAMLWTWKVRNKLIFNSSQIGISDAKALFFQELRLTTLRVKESLTDQFEQWIQSLQ
jgi:hypothetical protein